MPRGLSNIIEALPLLTWRGLFAPCDNASYRGGHVLATRSFPYVDGEGHDNTGRMSYQFQPTRLHFHNGFKPYNWYPAVWNAFRPTLEDGTAGDLIHPDLGKIRARVVSWDVSLTAQNRGGVTVDVVWVETVDDPDKIVPITGTTVSPKAIAAAADAAMKKAGISYPTGKPQTSLTEMVGAIEGFAFSATLTVKGAINQAIGTVEELIEAHQRIRGHIDWAVHGHLIALWAALKKMGEQVSRLVARPTSSRTLNAPTTLYAFARDVGNTTNEVMSLNLHALRFPLIPKGTTLTFYTS